LEGQRNGRDSSDEIAVFDFAVFALEKFSALRFLNTATLTAGLDERLAMTSLLDNPKNLFFTLLVRDAVGMHASEQTATV
jgi:hypothetical protein